MKNTQKGFIGIAILIIVALGLVGTGSFYVVKHNKIVQEAKFENDMKVALENTSSTGSTTTVTLGVTSETKTPITAEVSVKTDTLGNQIPSITVDQKNLNRAVVEKYGSNPAYIRQIIKVSSQAAFSSFAVEASTIFHRDYTYETVCNNAQPFIEAEIQKNLNSREPEDTLLADLGITIKSYRTSEIVCKSNEESYMISMPITLENGIPSQVCIANNQGGMNGADNFPDFTCPTNSK